MIGLVVILILFAAVSCSPAIQAGIKETTTTTELSGSIATGSFSFGKAEWKKSIFISINQHGSVKDINGNIVDEISSATLVDFENLYYESFLYQDGREEYNLGASYYGFYTSIGYGESGFRIDGGFSADFRLGLGFVGNSNTIDINPVGLLYDWISRILGDENE